MGKARTVNGSLAVGRAACDEMDSAPASRTSLDSQSLILAGLGRHQEALAVGQQAVSIYRELAAAGPARSVPA